MRWNVPLFALVASLVAAPHLHAQTLGFPYNSDYSVVNLGSVPGLPSAYGGLLVNPGNYNQLLIGGSANTAAGVINVVDLVRDLDGHITGFSGVSQLYAAAPNIDGGLDDAPGGVLLYSLYPTNYIGEFKPGSVTPDKYVDLTPMGITSSVGSLAVIPPGFANAGNLLIASYSGGNIYQTSLVPDGFGTYDLSPVSATTFVGGGPEGIAFIPAGNPDFATNSILVSAFSYGTVYAYELDANSNPIPGTATMFLTGLIGAEGATIDPLTGDFLFSTFGGGDQVVAVRGFNAPEPGTIVMAGMGAIGMLLAARQRRAAR